MRQVICVGVLLIVAVLLNAPMAAKMAGDGNWGEAVGSMLFAPIVVFYFVHSLVYYATRFLRGPAAVATYATSKLNYIAFVISLLGVLGAVAQRMTPPV
ncbi:hypothetical protein ACQZ6C_05300 [Rhizobium rhizogenes]|uniref:hypothetical protein n=2 Tax=Rhizobium TaxID=379 RepID=UPI0015734A40|nr:hypothetical protein [Rhizobium rhizogenes]NTF88025.1 hypothetical protein [Rhizobium rhizogenes]